ncbi:MAG: methyl-accepting chemotaxis protein [Desulfobacteraceae bacterium]|nr:methyl-accepting chemotaxis protein [Desulfobacteraceae bacterium]
MFGFNKLKPKAGLDADLTAVSNSISGSLTSVDPHFLMLGEKLNETFSASEQLSGLVLNTLNLDQGGEDKNRLKDIHTVSDTVIQTLRSAQENIQIHLTHLASGIMHLESLSRGCGHTDRLSMLLNVITLNIAVESRRSRESNQMFEVFVQEIGQLAHRIKTVSTVLNDDAEKEKQCQQAYLKTLKQKLESFLRLTEDSGKAVKESTKTIQDLIAASFHSLEKAISHSAAITAKISEIVMAIQFHDIVRQKLEHVVAALDEIHPADKKNTREASAASFSALKVQKAQVLGVVSEIRDAHDRIMDAFHTIDREAQALAQCLSATGIEKEAVSEADLFSGAIESMMKLTSLLTHAEDLDRQMEEAVATASDSIKKLNRHIRTVEEISLDLHRKALNAVIKSASLGEIGLALEVLAQEVTKTSHALNEFTATVTGIIQAVSETTDKSEQKTSGLGQSHALLNTAIQHISQDYERFRENSSAARGPAERFTHLLSWAKTHLSFMPEFAEILENQSRALDKILSGMPEADMGSPEIIPEASIYTMESERLIHSEVVGGDAKMIPPDVKDPPKDEKKEPDSLGDNVDLF